MSKNMTRKGLAFGAGLSLVASGFAGLPASAEGLTGFITLLPETGLSTGLAVGMGANNTFTLEAQAASSVGSAGKLKFLVTDSAGLVRPKLDGLKDDRSAVEYPSTTVTATGTEIQFEADGDVVITGTNGGTFLAPLDVIEFADNISTEPGVTIIANDTRYTVKASTSTTITIDGASAGITRPQIQLDATDAIVTSSADANVDLTNMVAAGTAFAVDDIVSLSADLITTGDVVVLAAVNSPFTVDAASGAAASGALSFNGDSPGATIATTLKASPPKFLLTSGDLKDSLNNSKIFKVSRPSAVANSVVVDSGVKDGSAISLTLEATTNAVQSATVIAWVDNFDNNVIDATEYVSAATTISFVDMSLITYATVLTNPQVGDETLVATTTTSPVLNGVQMDASDTIRALFARADSSTALLDNGNATQSATTGAWTSEIDLQLASNQGSTVAVGGALTAAVWAGGLLAPDIAVAGDGATDSSSVSANAIEALSINATTKTVTVTTEAAHQLLDGDLITMTATGSGLTSAADASRPITVTGETTFTYVLDTTGTVTAGAIAADAASTESYAVVTYTSGDTGNQAFKASRVFAGDYSATPYYSINTSTNWFAGSTTASTKGTLAVASADVILTTAGSASVQSIRENDATNDGGVDLLLKAGTTSATVTATVVDSDGDAVGAGRSVSVTPSGATSGAGIKVAGSATLATLLTTDANGQVEIVITSTAGANAEVVDITVVAEGAAATTSILEVAWATAALQMSDLAVSGSKLNVDQGTAAKETRYVAEGASYAMNLLVTDQWFTVADSATYRLKVTGDGVNSGFVNLVDGKATVTVSDVGVSTNFDSTLTLQKKSTAGVWGDTTTVAIVNTKTDDNPGVLLGADGSTLYGQDGSETADLSDAVAAKALVERDTRSDSVVQPAYANSVVVTGKIVDAGTKAALGGAVVTVSGPSNILFVNGSVESRGSITFLASEADGEFDVTLYSTTAQTDSVITVTSMGASKTTKVSFTGIGIGEGTVLTVTTPAAVKPASTFQVGAKLADAYGNGVASATVKVPTLVPESCLAPCQPQPTPTVRLRSAFY